MQNGTWLHFDLGRLITSDDVAEARKKFPMCSIGREDQRLSVELPPTPGRLLTAEETGKREPTYAIGEKRAATAGELTTAETLKAFLGAGSLTQE